MSRTHSFFALCVKNEGYEADLLAGKIYKILPPEKNDRKDDMRVVDESGEDYLYPAEWFIPLELPPKAKRFLSSVA